MIEDEYNPLSNELLKHRSEEEVKENDDEDQIITLQQCLNKFYSTEKLQDLVNCTKCKKPTEHIKTFKMSRLPPIMSI